MPTRKYPEEPPLIEAVLTEDVARLRQLLSKGADPNTRSSKGESAVALAAREPGIALLLIDAGAKIQKADLGSLNAVWAAATGRADVLARVLDLGGDVNQRSPRGYPLEVAARHGFADVVELLIERGADVNAGSPLGEAVREGHVECARRLIEAGADSSAVPDADKAALGLTAAKGELAPSPNLPLIGAARKGDVAAVRMLLEGGADPTLDDGCESVDLARCLYREVDTDEIRKSGVTLKRTALHEAAEGGHAEVVEALLSVGAPVDTPDVVGLTPLLIALKKGHAKVARMLLAAGANIKAVDADRTGALSAAVAGGNAECVQVVLQAGARLPSGKKHNLVAHAALRSTPAMVRTLVEAGAPVDKEDQFGSTALIQAAEAGRLKLVHELLRLGADVNHANQNGDTALIRGATIGVSATQWGKLHAQNDRRLHQRVELARTLLDAGANIDALSNYGQNALAMAAVCANEPLVRFLLDRGADPSLGDVGGTALEHARKWGFAGDLIDRLSAPEPGPTQLESSPIARSPQIIPPKVGELWQPPDLSSALNNSDYLEAVAQVEKWCGSRAVPLDYAPGVFLFHIDSRSDFDFESARQAITSKGFTLVWTDTLNHLEVGLFPTDDPLLALRAMGTNGANFDLSPDHVAKWLRELYAEHPFEITGLETDVVDGRFLAELPNTRKLAKRMYEFCPDVVDQGTGSVAALARVLKETRRLYFWWD